MGLLIGRASFTMLETIGDAAAPGNEGFLEKIRAYAFRDIFPENSQENVGWTSIQDALEFFYFDNIVDDARFSLFALRIDRRKIPAAIMKMRCQEAEKEFLRSNGIKRLYKDQREAIRESVRAELETSIPPVPKVFEVIWDKERHIVYFSSLSSPIIDDFSELFFKTFGIRLRPANIPDQQKLAQINAHPAYIGMEFLTWLWFKSTEHDGTIEILGSGITDIIVSFFNCVILESGEGEYAETVVCKGNHADLREAKEALRQGKKISQARIKLSRDGLGYEFTYRDNLCQFQTLALPPVDPDKDYDDRSAMTLERIYLLRKIVEAMNELNASFMKLRLSSDWPAEETKMRKWVLNERP